MRLANPRRGIVERVGLGRLRPHIDRWTVGIDNRFTRPYLQAPVRLLLGNDAGLIENIRGRRALARPSSYTTKSLAAEGSLSSLSKFGFQVLGYPFSDELVCRLRGELHDALDSQIGSDCRAPYRFVEDPEDAMPSVKTLLQHPIFEEISRIYRRGSRLMYVRAWRNFSWPEDKFTSEDFNSNLWHNDQARTDIFKVFLLLCDGVTADNGATRLLSKDETKKVMRSGYLHRTAMSDRVKRYLANPKNVTYMEGDLGFSYIFNPQLCLHGAGNARLGGFRDVVMLQFCGQ